MKCETMSEKNDVSEEIQTNRIAVKTGKQLALYSTDSPAQGFPWQLLPKQVVIPPPTSTCR